MGEKADQSCIFNIEKLLDLWPGAGTIAGVREVWHRQLCRGNINQEGRQCGKGPQVGSPRAPRLWDTSSDDVTLVHCEASTEPPELTD